MSCEIKKKKKKKKKMLQIQFRELHVHFAFSSTFHVARGILLYIWIVITEIECDNAFDFMCKIS